VLGDLTCTVSKSEQESKLLQKEDDDASEPGPTSGTWDDAERRGERCLALPTMVCTRAESSYVSDVSKKLENDEK